MDIEEYKDELPPIPDGWMGVLVPDACLSIANDYGVVSVRIDGLRIETVCHSDQPFDPKSKMEVIVLMREHR